MRLAPRYAVAASWLLKVISNIVTSMPRLTISSDEHTRKHYAPRATLILSLLMRRPHYVIFFILWPSFPRARAWSSASITSNRYRRSMSAFITYKNIQLQYLIASFHSGGKLGRRCVLIVECLSKQLMHGRSDSATRPSRLRIAEHEKNTNTFIRCAKGINK